MLICYVYVCQALSVFMLLYVYCFVHMLFIGADTVLKLGAKTPARSTGIFFSVPPKFALCPKFRVHNGGIPQWKKQHCENNMS